MYKWSDNKEWPGISFFVPLLECIIQVFAEVGRSASIVMKVKADNNKNQLIVSEESPVFIWSIPYFYPGYEWGFTIFLYRMPFLYNEKIWVNKSVSCFN